MSKTKTKKNIKRKNAKKAKIKEDNTIITMGNIGGRKAKLLLLIVAIVFVETFLIVPKLFHFESKAQTKETSMVYSSRNFALEKEIKEMVQGYPIESMVPYIASKDKQVAAFLVAIAKKESAWGKRKPVLNGEDCYNYWGFRLRSENMGSGGHTCFDNPKQAVDAVSDRIEELVKKENIDTPKKMIVWKCGYACNGPQAQGAQKWISDVDYYYRQMIN